MICIILEKTSEYFEIKNQWKYNFPFVIIRLVKSENNCRNIKLIIDKNTFSKFPLNSILLKNNKHK